MRILPLVSEVTSQNVNSSNNVTGGGTDYDSGPYSVTFTAGVTSVLFDVPINNDNIFEMNEDFTLTIIARSLPDGVTRDKAGPATVNILDDDGECVNCYVNRYKSASQCFLSLHQDHHTCYVM